MLLKKFLPSKILNNHFNDDYKNYLNNNKNNKNKKNKNYYKLLKLIAKFLLLIF